MKANPLTSPYSSTTTLLLLLIHTADLKLVIRVSPDTKHSPDMEEVKTE